MREKMTEEKAANSFFNEAYDCSQVVLAHVSDAFGLDRDTTLKISAGFGGGMWRGEICGCVSGGLMAIGLKYGHYKIADIETKLTLISKAREFEDKFKSANGSLYCRELTGLDLSEYDLTKPEILQKILEMGKLQKVCPVLAASACQILDEML